MSTSHLLTIHNNLEKLIDSKREAMPKSFNKTRFLQNCMTVLQDTKDVGKCDPQSVARTLLKGAFLGLDFFNKECYAITYGGSVQFQTDYKGEKKLAKKYSVRPVKDIYAKLVREGDEFIEEIKDGQPTVQFKPLPFNDSEIKGAFAVSLFEDDGLAYEVMSVAEIELTRKNYSKQPNGQAWVKSKGEMYKKTVLRRLCKNIELDFDTIEQAQAFEDSSDFEFNKEPKQAQQSPLNPQATVIDAEYEEVKEESDNETNQE
ncbi:RecT family recombinase [Paenibacillus popilliae]|uniref:Recombinational DNA repair protein n=1 Tax=Paenibacillus popilliae ATCC 14706 TaxID=1212764 RepID=M9LQ39_PAEPP|nr:RecT family recombinase [Paenibacillus popilliae]GAC42786.1 recombinational DNA repair protein [Paenibacillus popilliae ATCC 14706]